MKRITAKPTVLAASLVLATDDNAKPLRIAASDPGAWGNDLAARVDRDDITDAVFARYKALLPTLKKTDLFNLSVANLRTGAVATVAFVFDTGIR